VSSANTSDQVGFLVSYATILLFIDTVVKVFADRGYRGEIRDWLKKISAGQTQLEIVSPPADRIGFGVDPKRWIVERTWAWFNWSRRLSKDYEHTVESSCAWLDVSAIRTALGKLLK
jgi:transposase